MDQIIEKKLSDASIHFLYFNLSQQFFLYVHARSIHVSIYEKKPFHVSKHSLFMGQFLKQNSFLVSKRGLFMGHFTKKIYFLRQNAKSSWADL